MLIGLVVWTALLTLANAATASLEFAPGQASPGTEDAAVARGVYTSGLSGFGYVFALVLGVLVIGTEFRHQTVTPTFLGTPRRARLVLAKWLASALFGLLYGVVGSTWAWTATASSGRWSCPSCPTCCGRSWAWAWAPW